jgi:hypothetical protein
VGGKLFGVILNNVNIKTDDNYYYYAGYSTQYGYKKRTPRAGSSRRADAQPIPAVPEDHPAAVTNEVAKDSAPRSEFTPKVTFVRPPQGQDRF